MLNFSNDNIKLVEASYALELDYQDWLQGISDRANEAFGHDRGMLVHVFQASSDGTLQLPAHASTDLSNKLCELALSWIRGGSAEFLRQSHIEHGPASTLSGLIGKDVLTQGALGFAPAFGEYGIRDIFGIRGLNLDGTGIMISIPTPDYIQANALHRETCSQLAAHLTAGLRLRSILEGRPLLELDEDDAVLAPGGQVLHAEGASRSKRAREVLRNAAINIDRARGQDVRTTPEALEMWRGLVAGEWSMVDCFDSDGRRFIVARKNSPAGGDPRALTRRERQVLGYATLGFANKEIAYTLGLSIGTVATHLRSGLGKLGLKSRHELIRLFTQSPTSTGDEES